MKFKVLKTSETGLKLSAVFDKVKEADEAVFTLINEYGATKFRGDNWSIAGGLSCIIFDKNPPYWFKPALDGHLPKLNTKKGKELQARIEKLPLVSRSELNKSVGLDEQFRSIGVTGKNEEWYLLDISENTGYEPLVDVIEITVKEFNELKGV